MLLFYAIADSPLCGDQRPVRGLVSDGVYNSLLDFCQFPTLLASFGSVECCLCSYWNASVGRAYAEAR
jgi:hypothetical protein